MFEQEGVIHLNAANSDHAPILICDYLDHTSAPKPFRFLEAWSRDHTYELVINKAWVNCSPMGDQITLENQLLSTSKALRIWNKEVFGFCQSLIKDLEDQLKLYQGLVPTEENI